jgi:hypothetical protein
MAKPRKMDARGNRYLQKMNGTISNKELAEVMVIKTAIHIWTQIGFYDR